mgnify:CR=1 FL=1
MTGEYRYIPPKPPLGFTVGIVAGLGGLAGLMTAQGDTGLMLPFLAIGAVLFAALTGAVALLLLGEGLVKPAQRAWTALNLRRQES